MSNSARRLRRHPNIVDVKEVVVDRTYQKVYMVMEYADHDLKSLMEVRASACIALCSVHVAAAVANRPRGPEAPLATAPSHAPSEYPGR